jgi:LPS sulfotransferase NodH
VSAAATGELVGFKLPQSSLNSHPRSGELVESKGVDLIRMRRANRVAQYVSVLMARDSGVWQSTDGSYGKRQVRVDPRRCIKALHRIDRSEAALDRLAAGHRVFELRYEELALGHGVNEVQEFLGVEAQSLTSPYEQLRTLPLEDAIENYDELASALAETSFAADLQQSARTGRDR